MKVHGYSLPLVEVEGVKTLLYPHQDAVLNAWRDQQAFLLVTKTGSGKTRAVALPVVKHRESAVFVYPTNALIADQARAIQQLLREEGISFREWTPDNADEKLGEEEYAVVQVNADVLEDFRRAWRLSQKSDALLRLLRQDKRKLILVNPDILYLLLSLRYGRASADAIGHLQAYSTVVIDEFHLYHGVELAHALFMIQLARSMNVFQRVVLLSATPNAEVRPYLDSLLGPQEITAETTVPQRVVGERQVAHEVALQPLPYSGTDSIATARTRIIELNDDLQRLQRDNSAANARGEYIPCVVILNSVVKAIALEDELVASGFPRELLVPIRGLSARNSRDLRGKMLVIGTSAIEVGIDFQTDHLLFEAGDSSSFMQRFGRIGRHRPGQAQLLCDHREASAFASLGTALTRAALERGISAIYPQQDARGWFVKTGMGLLSVCAQAANFQQRIREDRHSDPTVRDRVVNWMDETLVEFAKRLGIERFVRPVLIRRKHPWFSHYCDIDAFRTSLPSQTVWDVSEKNRGRDWNYDADVRTLLNRADRLWFNHEHKRLYVSGYGKWRYVWFHKTFAEMPEIVGTIQTTADTTAFAPEEMVFTQEGHSTSVSHVMYKPSHHIFIVVPADVSRHLDWRIAWFRCGSKGPYIIAFDGDALLVKEVADRILMSPDR